MTCRGRGAHVRHQRQPAEVSRAAESAEDKHDDLLAEVLALEAEDASEHAQRHKLVVRDEFGRGEGRERVEEQLCGLAEVADREEVDARVDLEAVAAVPVASLVDEPASVRLCQSESR